MILGCCDSRVPPEIIFDCGLGDLFTIRTAGHVIDRAVIESLEYGIEHLHIPLLLVLGHSRCGAVQCAMEAYSVNSSHAHGRNDVITSSESQGSNSPIPHDMDSKGKNTIIEQIRPAIEAFGTEPASIEKITKAHVRFTVAHLEKQLRSAHDLEIIGAYYSLESGFAIIL